MVWGVAAEVVSTWAVMIGLIVVEEVSIEAAAMGSTIGDISETMTSGVELMEDVSTIGTSIATGSMDTGESMMASVVIFGDGSAFIEFISVIDCSRDVDGVLDTESAGGVVSVIIVVDVAGANAESILDEESAIGTGSVIIDDVVVVESELVDEIGSGAVLM